MDHHARPWWLRFRVERENKVAFFIAALINAIVADGILVTVSEERELTSDSDSFWLGTSPDFQDAQSARAFRHE